MQFDALSPLERPLLDKFYRAHHAPMRSKGQAQLWVAREASIIAGMCLTPVADGHWLTGLFVAPERRRRGVAQALLDATRDSIEGSLWLFCDPALVGFYQRSGFAETEALPQGLADRLARYRQTKVLVAMVRG